jgi:hypothetical protein
MSDEKVREQTADYKGDATPETIAVNCATWRGRAERAEAKLAEALARITRVEEESGRWYQRMQNADGFLAVSDKYRLIAEAKLAEVTATLKMERLRYAMEGMFDDEVEAASDEELRAELEADGVNVDAFVLDVKIFDMKEGA